jgi:hypothetical protein
MVIWSDVSTLVTSNVYVTVRSNPSFWCIPKCKITDRALQTSREVRILPFIDVLNHSKKLIHESKQGIKKWVVVWELIWHLLCNIFATNSLYIKEKSSFRSRSQLILSVKPFKWSWPIVDLQFLTCFNTLKVRSPEANDVGNLTKIRNTVVILRNSPKSIRVFLEAIPSACNPT